MNIRFVASHGNQVTTATVMEKKKLLKARSIAISELKLWPAGRSNKRYLVTDIIVYQMILEALVKFMKVSTPIMS